MRKMRKGRKMRLARRARRASRTTETASLKEVYEFAVLDNNTAYIDYQNSLARSTRAAMVAQGFREFCITKVEYIFKPTLDTFQGPILGGTTVPYLYAAVDRTGALVDFTTADQLRNLGVKPRRLDDKTLRVSFKPAVLNYARDLTGATNIWSQPKVSPWLSTDKNNDVTPAAGWAPSSIDHLGLAWYVESGGNNTVLNQYNVEVVTHYKFRKPNIIKPVEVAEGVEPPKPAKQVE